SAALSRAYPEFYHESAHNILLDALTAQGALGLVALLAFIALAFHQARKIEGMPAGLLGACLVAGVAANQFMVFTLPTALSFYLTISMFVAAGKRVTLGRYSLSSAGALSGRSQQPIEPAWSPA